jgi:hypothetical protein
MLSLFMTSYSSNAPSMRGTMCPLICFGHWIFRSAIMSKDSRSSSIKLTVYTTLSTDMRRLEVMAVGGRCRPKALCTNVLFPTPALPIIAILISDIPLLDWGCFYIWSATFSIRPGGRHTGRFTASADGLLAERAGSSSATSSSYVADLNSFAIDTELGDW